MSAPFSHASERPGPLAGRRVAFVGRMGGVSRREAARLARQQGAIPVTGPEQADLVVIGADELPVGYAQLLGEPIRQRAAAGQAQVITESQFWERLGLVESQQHVRRLYTPAMLAEMLEVPLATVRQWHRRGWIRPSREVHRLPYFDFQEAATARRLAEWLAQGISPQTIERELRQLARLFPEVQRPMAQLSLMVDGPRLLVRGKGVLVEPGGQLRFDFPAADEPEPRIVRVDQVLAEPQGLPNVAEMVERAAAYEEQGEVAAAAEAYRAALLAGGPSAELCFRLAELLYQTGDLTAARERYWMAIELDDDFVEARANLGCVLAELGDHELALAAFQGALRVHAEYPDAHYHLARLLDDLGREEESVDHWRQFLACAPSSPWAEQARQRLPEADEPQSAESAGPLPKAGSAEGDEGPEADEPGTR